MERYKTKRVLAVLLAVILTVGAFASLPTNATAAETGKALTAADKTYYVNSAESFKSAADEIESNSSERVSDIYITSDFSSVGGVSFKNESYMQTINIYGDGHTISYSGGTQGIYAWQNINLNLYGSQDGTKTFTLLSDKVSSDGNKGLLYCRAGTTCTMNKGVILKGRRVQTDVGGGVTVESGTFIMNGGLIEDCAVDGGSVCYGGGVGVYNGAYFVMNGGTIKDCFVESAANNWQTPWVAGGGVFVCASAFEMNGGTIEGCSAKNRQGDSQDAVGGGVAVVSSSAQNTREYGHLDSSFIMNDGTIQNCSAAVGGGALAAGLRYIRIRGLCAKLYPNTHNMPNGIYFNGGKLLNNSSDDLGGAILLNWIRGNNVKIKNTEISGNRAVNQGGAIAVFSYWTQAQIENCKIMNNSAEANGAGVALLNNGSGNGTHIKDTTITGNTITDTYNNIVYRGAGIYYDANSKLTVSGANVIQNNKYNGKLNNLNILKSGGTVYPVYVDGALTGSQIGLSDPKLWDDNLEDSDASAVSEDYLTSGFKTNNGSNNPSVFFTSDHDGWYADYSDVEGRKNEVRLFRASGVVTFHVNNADQAEQYGAAPNDIFRTYSTAGGEEAYQFTLESDRTVKEFYDIPKLKQQDEYVFKGWFYDEANDNDSHPLKFGEDKFYSDTDVYAHWIKVGTVSKDSEDDKELPNNGTTYRGFGLTGVQIRPEANFDHNVGDYTPGGLRFIASISENLLSKIDALSDKTTNGNKVEYGFVTAAKRTIDKVADDSRFGIDKTSYKLQYKAENVNGIDTLLENATKEQRQTSNNFRYVTNVDCTSKQKDYGSNARINRDHRNYNDYRLATYVVTYDDDNTGENKDVSITARAYIRYYDKNGLLRTFYNDYGGTNVYGGCSASYNAVDNNRKKVS